MVQARSRVHEDVDPPMDRQGLVDGCPDIDRWVAGGPVQDKRGALLQKAPRGRDADVVARARDDCDLVLKIHAGLRGLKSAARTAPQNGRLVILARNWIVLSFFGCSKNVDGGASSTICPSSMKTMRSATALRKSHVVSDDDHGHSPAGELGHHGQDLADKLGIEGRRRLIEQHDFRVHGQRPGDRDPLLLSARELGRVGVFLVLEADEPEQLQRPSRWPPGG